MKTITLFAFALFITAHASAQAHMCGVADIEAVDDGLQIKFSPYVARVEVAR